MSYTQVVPGYIIPRCLYFDPEVKNARPAFLQSGLVITFADNTNITATGPFNFTPPNPRNNIYSKVEISNGHETHGGKYYAYHLTLPESNKYKNSLFVLNVGDKNGIAEKCYTDKNGDALLGGVVKRPISSTISSIQRKHHTKPKNPRSHSKRKPSHRKRKTQKRKKT